jgi:hypothetical protein
VPNAPYPPSLPPKLSDLSIGHSLTCSAVCLLHLARYFNLVPLNSVTAVALCSTVQCRGLPVFVKVLCHITMTSHITDTIKAYQSHVCRTSTQTTSTLFHNTRSHLFAPRVPLTRSPCFSRHHTWTGRSSLRAHHRPLHFNVTPPLSIPPTTHSLLDSLCRPSYRKSSCCGGPKLH